MVDGAEPAGGVSRGRAANQNSRSASQRAPDRLFAEHNHAVIGIAALNNCAVQIVPRYLAIGWSAAGLALAVTTLFSPADPRRAREASEPALGIPVPGLVNPADVDGLGLGHSQSRPSWRRLGGLL